jgi:hypothetical protein
MAFGYKILGRKSGNGTTQVAYTVPTGKSAIVSSLVLNCNEENRQYKIFVVPAGETQGGQHQLVAATGVNTGVTHTHQFGITLAAGDSIHFYGTSGEGLLNLFVFGTEADA